LGFDKLTPNGVSVWTSYFTRSPRACRPRLRLYTYDGSGGVLANGDQRVFQQPVTLRDWKNRQSQHKKFYLRRTNRSNCLCGSDMERC